MKERRGKKENETAGNLLGTGWGVLGISHYHLSLYERTQRGHEGEEESIED